MADALKVATLRLVLNHFDFLGFPGEDDRTFDLCALDEWHTDGRVRAVVDEEYLIKYDCVTFSQVYLLGIRELLYRNNIAFRDDVLLPSSLDYGHFHCPINVALISIKDKGRVGLQMKRPTRTQSVS